MKAYWSEGKFESLQAPEDLEAVIAAVRQMDEPTMLFLEHESGLCLVLGLGQDESVLTFAEPGGISFHSLGNAERGGTMSFMCNGELDAFANEMAIPESVAMESARIFFATGIRPENVVWESDW
jgi:hypothetical protein